MLLAGALVLPSIAFAQNEEGRRNTAIGLTAGAIYALSKGKDTLGLGLSAGAAYAWKRYLDAKQERERREAVASAYRYRTAPSTTTGSRPTHRSTVYRRSAVTQSAGSRPVSASTQAELARLRAAYAEQQAQQQQLRTQLAALQEQVAVLKQQIAQHQETVKNLTAENSALRAKAQEQEQRANSARAGMLASWSILALLACWTAWTQLRRFRIRLEIVAPREV
jgi:TolA-binding protein